METIIHTHIEKLSEELYLVTSDQVQGLIAQGRTLSVTKEITTDVAKKLVEAQEEIHVEQVGDKFDFPLVVVV